MQNILQYIPTRTRVIASLLFFLVFFSAQKRGMTQNLVQNGSFEELRYCPVSYNQQTLKTAVGWSQTGSATPDHFAECNTNTAGVPDNIGGSQNALDGTAYIGLVTYTSTKRNYREYVQSKLTRPLGAGEMICVEFWVSCGDLARYVTDGIGVHFSKAKVKTRGDKLIEAQPQVANPRLHILDNTTDWVRLSDVFVAEGGEQYITIGNFYSDKLMSKLMRTSLDGVAGSSQWSYIYIDDVIVRPVQAREECSCINDKIKETVHDPPLQLFETTQLSIETVQFAFDDSTLTSEAQLRLDEVASLMRKNPYLLVRVNGHTDIVGREGYNKELSANRAKAVLSYLRYQGIDPQRLELKWYGSQLPIADNTTAEGRAQNRRVDFELLKREFILAGE
jgi:outer membrane protein OmpA-like peptidoglycan-associated protein